MWAQPLPAEVGMDAGMCTGSRAGIQTQRFSHSTAPQGMRAARTSQSSV